MRRSRPRLGGLPLILWGLVLLLATGGANAAGQDPGRSFFDQTFGDLPEELEHAREQGKKGILLMFEMDECPFCHRMKATVLNQPEIQDYYREHFLIFAIDVEGDVEITDFSGNAVAQKDFALNQFRVRATPVFAFFDLEGSLVARYTGATRNAEEFRWLGDYVVGGEYRRTSFTNYKRERERAGAKP